MTKNRLLIFLIMLMAGCSSKNGTDTNNEFMIKKTVYDNSGLLSDLEEKKITSLIEDIENNAGAQIAVLIIDTLNGESIDGFAARTFQNMKMGRDELNNDLLILVASKEDYQIKIEVGTGLEKIIPDEETTHIIKKYVNPKFKEHKFYEGLYDALNEIKKKLEE